MKDVSAVSEAIVAYARSHQLGSRNRVCRHGITVSQCYALELIAANTGITITAMAEALGLDKSTTSRVVEGLRTARLVTFAAGAANRREKPLAATARGEALNRKIHQEILAEHARVLASFSVRERKACRDILSRLSGGEATPPPTADSLDVGKIRPPRRR